MDIAIVAPCPIPYVIGGAENLWRGLQDHLNRSTPHQAEIIKLPSREHSFWELIDTYRRFSELDLTGFDLVVSSKYPAWMVRHDRHVVYMLHKLRGLYDTYHFLGLPDELPDAPVPVRELRAWMAEHAGRRDALGEFFERASALRGRVPDAFPGPLIREWVHWLDGVGLAPEGIHRYSALSDTVRRRAGYFPDGSEVTVVHPPSGLPVRPGRSGRYLFTVSRLDNAKRVALLVEAMRHVRADVALVIAGTGPEEARLRELAGGDARVSFAGRVGERELVDLYAGARAVAFVPYEEDYGLVTVEAFGAGKPVLTVHDGGGVTELVEDGVTGLITDPAPEALAAGIARLWSDRRGTRRMGEAALRRVQSVTWERLAAELTA